MSIFYFIIFQLSSSLNVKCDNYISDFLPSNCSVFPKCDTNSVLFVHGSYSSYPTWLLSVLGIKQTIQADEYGFLWTTTHEICITSIPAVYSEYGFFFLRTYLLFTVSKFLYPLRNLKQWAKVIWLALNIMIKRLSIKRLSKAIGLN